MKTSIRIAAIVLAVFTLLATPHPIRAAEPVDSFSAQLLALGFPEDYIEPLCRLHMLHPDWSFTPLHVTALDSRYTWDYVVHMETDDSPHRSLISSNSAYAAYRHPTNTTLYDTGWYQASVETVEYFLDPRNFLNEKDIFQFEDLSFNPDVTVSLVEAALDGTFMSHATLENGKTYAEYFLELGEQLGINPLHLASRARQEQGVSGSNQISGLTGDRLWYYYSNGVAQEGGKIIYAPASGHTEQELLGYNGLYNFYNIGAAGTGVFAVLLGAMKEARTGTPHMADQWGGSPSWDTKWKSIYGGAYKLCGSYIGNYQNTLYLQKWNVDARSRTESGSSRNFWGQYMQNVGAALSEAKTNYNALAAGGCLDCPYNFLIPVYSGMPSSCPDPAESKCELYAASDTKYSFNNALGEIGTADSRAVSAHLAVASDRVLTLTGTTSHSAGSEGVEYSLNGQAWQKASVSSEGGFSITLSPDSITKGNHTLAIRGLAVFEANDPDRNACRYYPIAQLTLTAAPAEQPTVTVTVNGQDGYEDERVSLSAGDRFVLPLPPAAEREDLFAGWQVTQGGSVCLLPAGSDVTVNEDTTLDPMFITLTMREGAAARLSLPTALRFGAYADTDELSALCRAAGQQNVELGLILCAVSDSGLATLHPDSLSQSSIPYTKVSANTADALACSDRLFYLTADTAPISDSFDQGYAATAYLRITYANGKTAYVCTDYDRENATRSPRQVAAAALSSQRNYSNTERAVLEELAK